MYYLYLHPSPAIAAEYLDFLTHGQSNTSTCTSNMNIVPAYPTAWVQIACEGNQVASGLGSGEIRL